MLLNIQEIRKTVINLSASNVHCDVYTHECTDEIILTVRNVCKIVLFAMFSTHMNTQMFIDTSQSIMSPKL